MTSRSVKSTTASGPSLPEDLAASSILAIGALVRRERQDRFTLEELATHADLSAGLISQLERGQGNPSLVTILKLARALDIPLGKFFQGPPGARRMLVTKRQRLTLEFPNEGGEGLVYELLTPDFQRNLGMIRAQIPSGWDNEEQPFSRPGEESVHVLTGRLEVNIGGELFKLEPGDTITYDSSQPHWWRNSNSTPAQIISAMTPPH